ncbi:hypothetical protein AAMO2058_000104600 [Amorphochlora amoebiformis]
MTRPLEAGVRPVISPNTNSGFVVGTADVADLSRTVKRKAAGGLPVLLEFSSNIVESETTIVDRLPRLLKSHDYVAPEIVQKLPRDTKVPSLLTLPTTLHINPLAPVICGGLGLLLVLLYMHYRRLWGDPDRNKRSKTRSILKKRAHLENSLEISQNDSRLEYMGWTEMETEEGIPYFYNENTGESAWDVNEILIFPRLDGTGYDQNSRTNTPTTKDVNPPNALPDTKLKLSGSISSPKLTGVAVGKSKDLEGHVSSAALRRWKEDRFRFCQL